MYRTGHRGQRTAAEQRRARRGRDRRGLGGHLPGVAHQSLDPICLRIDTNRGAPMSRVAVVTGGASGMGEATCHELGRRGHKIAVFDMNGTAAQRVTDDLRAQGVTAVAVTGDVSDRAAVDDAFAKVRSELGPTSILVTSAGLF